MFESKKFLLPMGLALMAMGVVVSLWAVTGDYNRPNPLMDYAPQEYGDGIFDTTYDSLVEADCRGCHGNSLVDRHHAAEDGQLDCVDSGCHDIGSGPQNVVVYHDCTLPQCHAQAQLDYTNPLMNGRWHHNTEEAAAGECTACHSPQLIAPLSEVRNPDEYPPSVITPTPYSCENCHHGQIVDGDHPNWDGTAATSYGKAILGNYETHHMSADGNPLGRVSGNNCNLCHSSSSYDPMDIVPSGEYLIRYCEKCHDIATLHGIGPHVSDIDAWEAVGFHVPESNTDFTDLAPSTFRTFTQQELCNGCHADDVIVTPDPSSAPAISLTADGLAPTVGVCDVTVIVRGSDFGAEKKHPGYQIQMRDTDDLDPAPWLSPISYVDWQDNRIEFMFDCDEVYGGSIPPENSYNIRVVTPTGVSNAVVFTLNDGPRVTVSSPTAGPGGTWVTLTGTDFGASQTIMDGSNEFGYTTIIDFHDTGAGSMGRYQALNYAAWSDTSVQVRIYDYFEDQGFVDPMRDYLQDGADPLENSMLQGLGLYEGKYDLEIATIYFRDENDNDAYDAGDIIEQVVSSQPVSFTLTTMPQIWIAKPAAAEPGHLLKMFGVHFGTAQENGVVRYSDIEGDASNPAFGQGVLLPDVKEWANTRIKVELDIPGALAGSAIYIWIEDGVEKSNYLSVDIVAPL